MKQLTYFDQLNPGLLPNQELFNGIKEKTVSENQETVVTKPGSEFSPEELRQTDVYKKLRNDLRDLPEDALVGIARQVIQARWDARRDEATREILEETFKRLRMLGVKSDRVLLNLTENKIVEKRAKSTRWSHSDYAEHVGEAFSRVVAASKYEDRNGEYKFAIEEPYPDNDVPFRCVLTEPTGFEIRFPPVDPDNLVETDKYREVSSVTNVMRKSLLRHPQSPAVFFKLELPKDGNSEDENSESEDTSA